MSDRDVLGIYIPMRISTLSDEEVLRQITELQTRREAILHELSKEKKASVTKGRKPKVEDLTKMQEDDVYAALAAQMGISVDEFKRLVASSK